jgi:hypothetical protein
MSKQEVSSIGESIGNWGNVAAEINRRKPVVEVVEVLYDHSPNDVDADCDVSQFLEPLVSRMTRNKFFYYG